MGEEPRYEDDAMEEDDLVLTVRQLQGLQHGVAASVMPVENGWRVHYFSQPTFEAEPGTDFRTCSEALTAIAQVLPIVNTPEEKARARDELRDYLRGVSERSTGDRCCP